MMLHAGWLRLSHEYRRPLHELMGWPGPPTYRQQQTMNYWLDEQLNQPSRTDHYLMRIALLLTKAHFQKAEGVTLKDMALKFTEEKPKTGPTLAQQHAAISKSMWIYRVTQTGPRPMPVQHAEE